MKPKVLSILLVVLFIFSFVFSNTYALDGLDTSRQVEYIGGTNSTDDNMVSVSKTIEETGTENIFDITLQVDTKVNIEELYSMQTDVVIVMDISYTMKNLLSDGTSRYNAAMSAVEVFVEYYQASAIDASTTCNIGYVAFNTDAHEIVKLQECSTEEQRDNIISEIKSDTSVIINDSGYSSSVSRFTNIEAGLKMARDMLSESSALNKYIIFLSDGFPTTYVESGYSGYNTYMNSTNNPNYANQIKGGIGSDGYFYNQKTGQMCTWGTSYSDKGATKAENLASAIKENTKIYTIGVGLGDQKISNYAGYVVDCYPTGTPYVIGEDTDGFEEWLRTDIGSGLYWDSTDAEDLETAYDDIFADILKTNQETIKSIWIASDPMSAVAPSNVEFLNFYDVNGGIVEGNLVNTNTPATENTAEIMVVDNVESIKWDLKNSVCEESGTENEKVYTYKLKYRVRLNTAADDFEMGEIYKTNGTTTLTYQVNENGTLSEPELVEFPIPEVRGYTGTLNVRKIDGVTKNALKDAELILTHSDECSSCTGVDVLEEINDIVAISGTDGGLVFEKIPSGHEYILYESKAPSGYMLSDEEYYVNVEYGEINTDLEVLDNEYVVSNLYEDKAENYQKEDEGGDNSSDDSLVNVSKTLETTEYENVFDITLKVKTTVEVLESLETITTTCPDTAVCLTIDMSGTMYRYELDEKRRVEVAKETAIEFLEEYSTSAEETTAKRMVAVSCFDTDAKLVQEWIDVNPNNNATGLDTVKAAINNMSVIDNGNPSSNYVCTNFDGGIILAKNILKQTDIDEDYCWSIVLSDGAPTVTVSGDTDTVGTIESTFWTGQGYQNAKAGGGWTHPGEVKNTLSYVQNLASEANVFMIGIGSGERGDMDFQLFYDAVYGTTNGTRTADVKNNANAFDGITPGISLDMTTGQWLTALVSDSDVNGTYVTAGNTEELSGAFTSIMESIKSVTEIEETISSSSIWVVTDPMSAVAPSNVEFLHFWDVNGNKAESLLNEDNPATENTASIVSVDDVDSIKWDLKNSVYKQSDTDTSKTYVYELKYRVRLNTAAEDFEAGEIYNTNGTTYLEYLKKVDGESSKKELIEFPIPAVKGYFGDLVFEKLDGLDSAGLSGAEFVLKHDDACSVCVAIDDMEEILDRYASSDEAGKVTFNNISSGHEYLLYESKAPKGYDISEDVYHVNVGYGITETDMISTDNKLVFYNYVSDKNIAITKRIKVADINFNNGDPTFIFKLTGCDEYGNDYTYHRAVTFTEEYVKENTDADGYVSQSVIIEDIKSGVYVASEIEVSRYNIEKIIEVTGGIIDGDTVKFDLINNNTGRATFVNIKYEYGQYSDSNIVVNHINNSE